MSKLTSWSPGDTITSPLGDTFRSIDPKNITPNEVYKILIQSVIPRPIAFVSSLSNRHILNLAPFSFFNVVCSNPATLVLGIGFKPDGSKKDTLANIESTGEFVVNSANRWLIDPLVYSAGNFAPDISEVEVTGLRTIPSEVVRPPRIKESAIQFECKLQQSLTIGNGDTGSTTVVFGEILKIHIAESAFDENGRINPEKLEAIARLGGISYSALNEIFQLEVPKI